MKHLNILNELPITVSGLRHQFPTRESIVEHVYRNYWPQHHPLWVGSIEKQVMEVYPTLTNHSHSGPFLIINAEEDTFAFDINEVRNAIVNHPRWSSESFFITNSWKDYQLNHQGQPYNLILRPCCLDLISYIPYDQAAVVPAVDSVTHYTGFVASTPRQERGILASWMQSQFADQISLLKYRDILINNTGVPTDQFEVDGAISINGNRLIDPPYQDIGTDSWMKQSAFVTVVESYYRSDFAPTLSEKTFKPMHLYRPAIVYGGRHTQLYLKHLGFDTWDWLIDWSFDSIADHDQRFSAFQSEISRLMNLPLPQISDLISTHSDSLIHNKQRIEYLINNYNQLPWDNADQ